jgi:hypothetical protein
MVSKTLACLPVKSKEHTKHGLAKTPHPIVYQGMSCERVGDAWWPQGKLQAS